MWTIIFVVIYKCTQAKKSESQIKAKWWPNEWPIFRLTWWWRGRRKFAFNRFLQHLAFIWLSDFLKLNMLLKENFLQAKKIILIGLGERVVLDLTSCLENSGGNITTEFFYFLESRTPSPIKRHGIVGDFEEKQARSSSVNEASTGLCCLLFRLPIQPRRSNIPPQLQMQEKWLRSSFEHLQSRASCWSAHWTKGSRNDKGLQCERPKEEATKLTKWWRPIRWNTSAEDGTQSCFTSWIWVE